MLLKLMNVTDFHETLNWKENLNAVFLSMHTDNYNHNNSTFFWIQKQANGTVSIAGGMKTLLW